MPNRPNTALQIDLPLTAEQRSALPSTKATALDQEYAAASGFRNWIADPRVLSRYEDAMLRELGRDAYEQAANDPVIESAVEDLVMSSTGEEPMFAPAFPEGHDRHDEAMAALEFCESIWAGIEDDAQAAVEGFARTAAYNGAGIAEVTFAPRGDGKYGVRYFKSLPREAAEFVVDRHMNVLAMLVGQYGGTSNVGGALYSGADLVAREKFVILTLRGKGNDPNGRSLVASAMTARGIKRQVLMDMVKFLAKRATIVPVGIAGEDAGPEYPIDPETGQPDTSRGQITAAQAVANQLALVEDFAAIGLAHGSEVSTLDLQGDSSLYLDTLAWLDLQMTRGILLQTLGSAEAQHGSRAQATVHENVKDLLVFWLKQKIARALRRDLFRNVMRVNFGHDDARDLTPFVSLGDTERKDWTSVAGVADTLIQTLEKLGYAEAADQIVASMQLSTAKVEPEATPVPAGLPTMPPPAVVAATTGGASA